MVAVMQQTCERTRPPRGNLNLARNLSGVTLSPCETGTPEKQSFGHNKLLTLLYFIIS